MYLKKIRKKEKGANKTRQLFIQVDSGFCLSESGSPSLALARSSERISYRAFHILPQIYTANYAPVPIQMYTITVIAVISEAPSMYNVVM